MSRRRERVYFGRRRRFRGWKRGGVHAGLWSGEIG